MVRDLRATRLGAVIDELPKSPVPAGTASAHGRFPFFCSSPVVARLDVELARGDTVIMGTGGGATVHLATGSFAYSTDAWAFRSSVPELMTEYLWRWIQSRLDWIEDQCFQGTGLRHLQKPDIRGLAFVVPDEDEQSRVLAVLRSLDEVIHSCERLVAKLLIARVGLVNDLLSFGVQADGRLRAPETDPTTFKASAIGPIPSGWEVQPLGQIASVDRGRFTHRPRNDPAFYGGDVPFIQTGDVTAAAGGVLLHASQTLNSRGLAVSKEFPVDTIAVTIAANIGETAILGRPMCFPDSVVGVVVREPNKTRWVEMSIRREQPRLDALAPQSAQKNINLEYLRPLLIPVPLPDEQERAVSSYDDLTARITSERGVLDKWVALRTAALRDLINPEGMAGPIGPGSRAL